MAPSRMHTLNSPLFKSCHTLETLGWANDATAKSLLQRAAAQVNPIMYKHGWTVPVLAEFYPDMPQLYGLNHNHGSKIELRLRSPNDPTQFLEYESILGTLLHELAHCEVGPHNQEFYKLLDQLNAECDELIAKGRTGGSFEGVGKRVGDGSSRYIPMAVARQRAVEAARQRERVQKVMGSGRLGGRGDIFRLCDPREMALAAAERRRKDDVWCQSGGDGGNQVIVVEDDDEVQIVEDGTNVQRRAPTRKARATRVPVRENAAAIAALRRAGQHA